MEDKEKLVVFDKYENAVDANIVKGALESSGIAAGVIGDSTANGVLMAPIMVVVFEHDLEQAIAAIYDGEMNYEDYQGEMTLEQFENMQTCNKTFCDIALKAHPEIGGKDYRDMFVAAKDALERCDLAMLERLKSML